MDKESKVAAISKALEEAKDSVKIENNEERKNRLLAQRDLLRKAKEHKR